MIILGKDSAYIGKEKSLQQAVIKLLRYNGRFAIHVPNGGRRDFKEAISLQRQGVIAGCPDILIFNAKGGPVALELKVKKGVISEHQKSFMIALENVGWRCFVCYNFKSVEQLLINKEI